MNLFDCFLVSVLVVLFFSFVGFLFFWFEEEIKPS